MTDQSTESSCVTSIPRVKDHHGREEEIPEMAEDIEECCKMLSDKQTCYCIHELIALVVDYIRKFQHGWEMNSLNWNPN